MKAVLYNNKCKKELDIERSKEIKYYIKATNTKTGETMVMSRPIFTSRKKAQEFANEFVKSMPKVASMEVIKSEH